MISIQNLLRCGFRRRCHDLACWINGFWPELAQTSMRCWLKPRTDTNIRGCLVSTTHLNPHTNAHLLQYDSMLGKDS